MEINSEYLLLQSAYRKLNSNKDDIFPECWYNVKEYKLKIEILKECIKNNILIKECKLYNNFRLIALR